MDCWGGWANNLEFRTCCSGKRIKSKVLRLSHPNGSDPVTNPVTPGQNGAGSDKIQFGSPNPVTPRFANLTQL